MAGAKPLVELLVDAFATRGVRRMYGVPGGGSSLDLIRAAAARAIPFVLARHETSAAIMALATGLIDDAPGVALTTIGPGLANAVNGMACATLDRAPLCLVSDGHAPPLTRFVTHQVFDQAGLSAAVVKGHSDLSGERPADAIEDLLDLAQAPPYGAIHLELSGAAARRAVPAAARRPVRETAPTALDTRRAQELLARAARPVAVVGLEARKPAYAAAVRRFCSGLGCPVLVTYQAKGVVPDSDPNAVGLFTGGTLESPCVETADLLLLIGLDPIELIPQAWRYRAPVIELALVERATRYVEPEVTLVGPLDAALEALGTVPAAGGWQTVEAPAFRAAMRTGLACSAARGLSPQAVVELALAAAGDARRRPRVTVDAGAHMFSATAFWDCAAPHDLLISNGLSTMGFALPAAIGAALAEPSRPVVAFTGDAGLAMCIGELMTARQQNAPVIVVVFNDGSLSLIDIKQQARELPPEGVRWARPDFARVAQGFGLPAWIARGEPEYRAAIADALAARGPALVDVHVDPAGYTSQIRALRG